MKACLIFEFTAAIGSWVLPEVKNYLTNKRTEELLRIESQLFLVNTCTLSTYLSRKRSTYDSEQADGY
jgi:hypothetical protein